jgi:hypothetical protein
MSVQVAQVRPKRKGLHNAALMDGSTQMNIESGHRVDRASTSKLDLPRLRVVWRRLGVVRTYSCLHRRQTSPRHPQVRLLGREVQAKSELLHVLHERDARRRRALNQDGSALSCADHT